MEALIAIVKPILFSFLTSSAVKELVIQLLEKYVSTTDNRVDDALVEIVREKLFTPQ
jgi:hypothetical protein